jgi:UDP-N-acetyl-D-galactosamine dehydrogenase
MFASNPTLCIIGLGYVGLPLAVEFGKKITTIGFDINQRRIDELRRGIDHTLELDTAELNEAKSLRYTTHEDDIKGCDVYIVTVPTPINESKQPDLTPLEKASQLLGRVIGKNSIVVFESTVYPGCTEEVCVPLIERGSGLVFNRDFFAGYSPERINPGDKQHRVHNITKITSGSTPDVAEYVDQLYRKIVVVGTHKASSIKVAEAAKVIENTQRDINIALINELALIFKRLNIDTLEVLEAAGTKWNFLPFRPGLVGGHCISVDPYYLTHKAQQVGYNPEVILAGRRINDGMGNFIADSVVKLMTQRKTHVVDSNILIMGLTFKENCRICATLASSTSFTNCKNTMLMCMCTTPGPTKPRPNTSTRLDLIDNPQAGGYDAVILCVGHQKFRELGADAIRAFGKPNHVLFDVKHILPKEAVDARL